MSMQSVQCKDKYNFRNTCNGLDAEYSIYPNAIWKESLSTYLGRLSLKAVRVLLYPRKDPPR